jgi:hypothetical protein
MNTVLQLQKLLPTASSAKFNILLVSTYSNICPSTGMAGESRQLEIE